MVITVDAYQLAYMAVPKAACSSMKAALARIDPDVSWPETAVEGPDLWHRLYITQRFRPHRWRPFETDGWFRFTLVRDPVARLLSCYVNRVVEYRDLRNSRRLLRGEVDLPMDPDPDFFFQNLDAYMSASSSIKHHALGTWLFTGPDLGRFTQVWRVEEMDAAARTLSEITGQRMTIPRENSASARLTLADLASRTLAALAPRLEREYAHLKGYYDNPL